MQTQNTPRALDNQFPLLPKKTITLDREKLVHLLQLQNNAFGFALNRVHASVTAALSQLEELETAYGISIVSKVSGKLLEMDDSWEPYHDSLHKRSSPELALATQLAEAEDDKPLVKQITKLVDFYLEDAVLSEAL